MIASCFAYGTRACITVPTARAGITVPGTRAGIMILMARAGITARASINYHDTHNSEY
jgi:hypothetical protein